MKRVALIIQYDGSFFSGWQRQKNAISIQETIENALLQVSNQRIKTFAAGRTDAGVHAIGQVAHFKINLDFNFSKILLEPSCKFLILSIVYTSAPKNTKTAD